MLRAPVDCLCRLLDRRVIPGHRCYYPPGYPWAEWVCTHATGERRGHVGVYPPVEEDEEFCHGSCSRKHST